MPICRLIYRSTACEDTLSNKELAAIQHLSVENNSNKGVTGLLVLSGDQFLQVLEGESKDINELYAKILQDSRHHSVRLISFESVPERFFENWAMRLVDLYDLPMQPRRFLMQKYSSIEDSICIPEPLNLVYSLLLDAKTLCISEPWTNTSP